MTRLTACKDAEAASQRAATHIARQLGRAREERGVAHLALSGGNTPRRTYELLAATPEALGEVEVWFADERCVAPDDPESNYLLAAETLLAGTAIPPDRVHRMHGEVGPHEGASRYASELSRCLVRGDAAGTASGLPVLDVIALGIGPDGHVASLFPGAATLDAEETALCLGVSDSPKPPPERITLSLPVLRAARECVLLVSGAGKADALAAMLGEPSRHVPASLLRRERLTVIADDAAAPGAARA